MEIKIDVKNLEMVVKRFEQAPDWVRKNIKSALNQSLRTVANNAAKEIKYKDSKNHLRMSIKQEVIDIDGIKGRVYLDPAITKTANGLSYGVFLHEGTGIYRPGGARYFVKPVKWKALRWVGPNGNFCYSKGHWVSGIVGNKFIYLGAEKSRAEINAIFARQVDRAINQTITDSGRILV